MKAIVWTAYGPPEVLQYQDIDKPKPKPDEILVKIIASNIFPGDSEMRAFKMHPLYWLPLRLFLGVFKPRIKIIGQEYAGIVEAVGSDVTAFAPGDAVFSPTPIGGSYAEYICVPRGVMTHKPKNMTFEEAATVPVGGMNALHFLRRGNVGPGQKVLIYGAAGCIGTCAVQIAKAMGAEVTAVDSTKKLPTLREIGADHVIDYTQEDFTERDEVYDVIVDVVGKSNYSRTLKCITPHGYYVLGNAPTSHLLRSLWSRWTVSQHVRPVLTGYKIESLEYLKELIEAGKLRAVIDRSYPFEEIVAAHHYIESGEKIGNVVLNIANPAT